MLYALFSINVMAMSIAIVAFCVPISIPSVSPSFFDNEHALAINMPIIVAHIFKLKVMKKTSGKESCSISLS